MRTVMVRWGNRPSSLAIYDLETKEFIPYVQLFMMVASATSGSLLGTMVFEEGVTELVRVVAFEEE